MSAKTPAHKNPPGKKFERARIRTWNLLIRSQTRYPLRHAPVTLCVVCEISSQQALGADKFLTSSGPISMYTTSMWLGHCVILATRCVICRQHGLVKQSLCFCKSRSRWRLATWVGDRLRTPRVVDVGCWRHKYSRKDDIGIVIVKTWCQSDDQNSYQKMLADRGFDPRTSGLWAQHASTAPVCCYEIRVWKRIYWCNLHETVFRAGKIVPFTHLI